LQGGLKKKGIQQSMISFAKKKQMAEKEKNHTY
jgi:hypothetical protein